MVPPSVPPDPRDKQITDWVKSHRVPGEPNFDTDAAWARFARGHDVNVIPLRRRFGIPIAVAAALLLAAGLGFWRLRGPSYEERIAPAGQQVQVALADGSTITLDGGSKLRYPKSSRKDVDVQLEGTAFFDVRHIATRTFRVRAAHGVITDIGTKFVVYADPRDSVLRVVVTEGRVSLASRSDSIVLSANETGTLDNRGALVKTAVANVETYTDWLTGSLVFDNLTLREAAAKLERRFGVRVSILDTALARKPVVARFHGESIDQVLDALTLAVGARYERSGSTYTIRARAK